MVGKCGVLSVETTSESSEKEITSVETDVVRGLVGASVLGKGSSYKGAISFEGPCTLEGEVEGSIESFSDLLIAKSGVARATVRGKVVRVFGTVLGDIVADECIEICAGAEVVGDIRCEKIIIHDLAMFEGSCEMKAPS